MAGRSQSQSRWLIHSDTWAGSSAVHDTGQVIADRVQVDCVFQPGGERGHGRSASYRARLNRRSTARCTRWRSGLNSAAAASVEAATATGAWIRNTWVVSSTSPAYTPDQQAGHDRIGQGPADDPVDLIQPVLQHRHRAGQRDARDRGYHDEDVE